MTEKIPNKKLGVITAVNGDTSEVGMYSMSNDVEFIWYGEVLIGPKIGAYLTISQNDIKIIVSVSDEKIIDQQNSIKSKEFDNRYSKNSINRILSLKTKGVIESERFHLTSQYVPMIGNEVSLTTLDELRIIYGLKNNEPTIKIGQSILENQPIQLSINRFFASHIGIFGNTGSGKSNTLHKLYLELFKTDYYDRIRQKSQFFVIDFNGEYSSTGSIFGVLENDKKVFKINTQGQNIGRKLPVTKEYLFDADILSILFDARPATQVPFLRSAMNEFINKTSITAFNFGLYVTGTLKKILTTGKAANEDSLQNWIRIAKYYCDDDSLFSRMDTISQHNNGSYCMPEREGATAIWFNSGSDEQITMEILDVTGIAEVSEKLQEYFNNINERPIDQLRIFLDFQKIHRTAWGNINHKFLDPLFNRIDSSLKSLEKVIDVKDEAIEDFEMMNIISLVNANQEITRLIPMLLSKMVYDYQKAIVSEAGVTMTKHLIIDEAHNILNAEQRNIGDDWQDYRLSVFEEIIKEGRKFGFFLTLSSQRPADISSTILSQTHNYLIHRLVNERDLKMLQTTMPTLDSVSYNKLPLLGKGEAIITGNAMQVPVLAKIDREELVRPSSDDIELTKLWSN